MSSNDELIKVAINQRAAGSYSAAAKTLHQIANYKIDDAIQNELGLISLEMGDDVAAETHFKRPCY